MSSKNDVNHKILNRMDRIVALLEDFAALKQSQSKRVTSDDERAAIAVIAVAKGANSFAAIAKELEVSESTARRNAGVRRALESVVTDRRGDQGEAEDFRWRQ